MKPAAKRWQRLWKAKKDSGRKKRGAMSIKQFKIIGERVWTRENGLEQEVWDSQQ
jgi:hypothetical protein